MLLIHITNRIVYALFFATLKRRANRTFLGAVLVKYKIFQSLSKQQLPPNRFFHVP